jgi:hypothetical protein
MSLRATALSFGGEAISILCAGIASGKEQERPRNDMLGKQVKEIIFLPSLGCDQYRELLMIRGTPALAYGASVGVKMEMDFFVCQFEQHGGIHGLGTKDHSYGAGP